MSKKHKPRVTVLCFFADGTQSKYYFNSKPDLARVQKEAVDDGVMVALVFNRKTPAIVGYVTRYVIDAISRKTVGNAVYVCESIFGKAKTVISVTEKEKVA